MSGSNSGLTATFSPRKEFLRIDKPSVSFSLLTFAGSSLLRLSNFPTAILSSFRQSLEPRSFKEDPAQALCEFTLKNKYWAQPKSVETEKLVVSIFALLLSNGYTLLSSIDYGREPDDKLCLAFARPDVPFNQGSNSSLNFQVPFAVSFPSSTTLRVIGAPLQSTPAILQAMRDAWPRGTSSEHKVGEGSYEFKLKGYSILREDTFPTDSLNHTLNLLSALDAQGYTLLTSVCLAGSHHRVKDLWIFAGGDERGSSGSGHVPVASEHPVLPPIKSEERNGAEAGSLGLWEQFSQPSVTNHQKAATSPEVYRNDADSPYQPHEARSASEDFSTVATAGSMVSPKRSVLRKKPPTQDGKGHEDATQPDSHHSTEHLLEAAGGGIGIGAGAVVEHLHNKESEQAEPHGADGAPARVLYSTPLHGKFAPQQMNSSQTTESPHRGLGNGAVVVGRDQSSRRFPMANTTEPIDVIDSRMQGHELENQEVQSTNLPNTVQGNAAVTPHAYSGQMTGNSPISHSDAAAGVPPSHNWETTEKAAGAGALGVLGVAGITAAHRRGATDSEELDNPHGVAVLPQGRPAHEQLASVTGPLATPQQDKVALLSADPHDAYVSRYATETGAPDMGDSSSSNLSHEAPQDEGHLLGSTVFNNSYLETLSTRSSAVSGTDIPTPDGIEGVSHFGGAHLHSMTAAPRQPKDATDLELTPKQKFQELPSVTSQQGRTSLDRSGTSTPMLPGAWMPTPASEHPPSSDNAPALEYMGNVERHKVTTGVPAHVLPDAGRKSEFGVIGSTHPEGGDSNEPIPPLPDLAAAGVAGAVGAETLNSQHHDEPPVTDKNPFTFTDAEGGTNGAAHHEHQEVVAGTNEPERGELTQPSEPQLSEEPAAENGVVGGLNTGHGATTTPKALSKEKDIQSSPSMLKRIFGRSPRRQSTSPTKSTQNPRTMERNGGDVVNDTQPSTLKKRSGPN